MKLGEEELPFNFSWSNDPSEMIILNSDERIKVSDIQFSGDSIYIKMPVFDSEFKGVVEADSLITGAWYNYSKGENYNIPFEASFGHEKRFYLPVTSNLEFDISGEWEVDFSPGKDGTYKSIGIFNQKGNQLTGTFITETGDYRYLDGNIMNDQIALSAFDGSHAFLFKATIDAASEKIKGFFWSGIHWKESWVAERNDGLKLRDPDNITFLKEDYDRIHFSFPDTDSNLVSLNDDRFVGKPVIVQILGSWCPNCMDESRLYRELYEEYRDKDLEIVGLAFERSAEFEKASAKVKKMMRDLELPYPVVIAGTSGKKEASEALPMLNEIVSYPTSIFIDRNGEIKKIHTGFYGPGTGEYYTRYVEELRSFLDELVD